MALTFADLSGVPAIKVRLVLPYTGIWHADVLLDRTLPAPLVGPQVLTLAGTTWACSVVRTADFAGQRRARLVGGTGGWRTSVPVARQYASPVGVPLAVVLADLAATVLELPVNLVGFIGSPVVGTAYIRQAGLASLALQDLLGDAWWMDPTGTIQTAPRLPTPIATPFSLVDVRGEAGYYVVAADLISSWVPGAVFVAPTATTPVPISRLAHVLDGGTLRTHLLAA